MNGRCDIRFGCQLYTWQMAGDKYKGKLNHIASIVKKAGFCGIESETCMLGEYYYQPKLKQLLDTYELTLGGVTLVCDWRYQKETEEEYAAANKLISFLTSFPDSRLILCQMPGKDRSDFKTRQAHAIKCIHAVARRATEKGISCSFHPNSAEGSVFKIESDYHLLLENIKPQVLGFAPDTGHIVRGGFNVYHFFETYHTLISHVHFKDVDADGNWVGLGEGIIDFRKIITQLRSANYHGWIMVEEESITARGDPDRATIRNGAYISRLCEK